MTIRLITMTVLEIFFANCGKLFAHIILSSVILLSLT